MVGERDESFRKDGKRWQGGMAERLYNVWMSEALKSLKCGGKMESS